MRNIRMKNGLASLLALVGGCAIEGTKPMVSERYGPYDNQVNEGMNISPADYNYLLGRKALEEGDISRAIFRFKQTVSQNPQHIQGRYGLGELCYLTGDYDRAEKEFDFVASFWMANTLESLRLLGRENIPESDINKKEVEHHIKSTADSFDRLSLALLGKGDRASASAVQYRLGRFFDRCGWKDLGLDHITKGMSMDPNPDIEIYNLAARLNGEAGNLEVSVGMLEKVLWKNPNSSLTHNNLGLIYLHQGREEKAKEEFEKAVEIDNDYFDGHNNLGAYYYNKKDYPKALKHWEIISRTNTEYPNLKDNLELVRSKLKD